MNEDLTLFFFPLNLHILFIPSLGYKEKGMQNVAQVELINRMFSLGIYLTMSEAKM